MTLYLVHLVQRTTWDSLFHNFECIIMLSIFPKLLDDMSTNFAGMLIWWIPSQCLILEKSRTNSIIQFDWLGSKSFDPSFLGVSIATLRSSTLLDIVKHKTQLQNEPITSRKRQTWSKSKPTRKMVLLICPSP